MEWGLHIGNSVPQSRLSLIAATSIGFDNKTLKISFSFNAPPPVQRASINLHSSFGILNFDN